MKIVILMEDTKGEQEVSAEHGLSLYIETGHHKILADPSSYDLLALDQACVDACMNATPIRNSQLGDNLAKEDFHDHHDHFTNSTPESEWKTCLSHAEKIGLGSRDYELITIK